MPRLNNRYEVARLDTIWTEVSEQPPSPQVFGSTPPKSDWRLNRYYQHLKDQMPDLSAPLPELSDQPWDTEEDRAERQDDQIRLAQPARTEHSTGHASSPESSETEQLISDPLLPDQDHTAPLGM